ncbi:MAG: hypothetical protein ACTSQF_13125 [Candidatus Heimdallarchaeaceae archaeon]
MKKTKLKIMTEENDYGIKYGIISELEEQLSLTLYKWLEKRALKLEENEDKKMIVDLLQGAEEVLNKWL